MNWLPGLHNDQDNRMYSSTMFYCERCDKYFAKKLDYLGHMNTRHLNARPYVCDLCNKSFAHLKSLQRHRHQMHHAVTRSVEFSNRSYVQLEKNVKLSSKHPMF